MTNDQCLHGQRRQEWQYGPCNLLLLPEAQHWGPKKHFTNFTVVFWKNLKNIIQSIELPFVNKAYRTNDKNKL